MYNIHVPFNGVFFLLFTALPRAIFRPAAAAKRRWQVPSAAAEVVEYLQRRAGPCATTSTRPEAEGLSPTVPGCKTMEK